MNDIEQSIQTLEHARTVEHCDMRSAGEKTPLTRAFEDVSGQLSQNLKPRLIRMLDRATAAGRVYAAMLLNRLDPAAGREAWGRLADDDSLVQIRDANGEDFTTVQRFAAMQREAPEQELVQRVQRLW